MCHLLPPPRLRSVVAEQNESNGAQKRPGMHRGGGGGGAQTCATKKVKPGSHSGTAPPPGALWVCSRLHLRRLFSFLVRHDGERILLLSFTLLFAETAGNARTVELGFCFFLSGRCAKCLNCTITATPSAPALLATPTFPPSVFTLLL